MHAHTPLTHTHTFVLYWIARLYCLLSEQTLQLECTRPLGVTPIQDSTCVCAQTVRWCPPTCRWPGPTAPLWRSRSCSLCWRTWPRPSSRTESRQEGGGAREPPPRPAASVPPGATSPPPRSRWRSRQAWVSKSVEH